METPYSNEPDDSQEEPVEIYSRRAIFWFAILFNPIFGGFLLMQNLRAVGYKTAGNTVILFSIAYYFITSYILGLLKLNMLLYLAITIGLNIVAGFILSEYFFPKYFPDNDYYPKNLTNAILVAIAVSLGFGLLSMYLSPMLLSKIK